MNKKKKKRLYWRITASAAVLLVIVSFTPLVIPAGQTDPRLFTMPYTLWVSILITILLVVLTYIGGLVYLNDEKEKSEE